MRISRPGGVLLAAAFSLLVGAVVWAQTPSGAATVRVAPRAQHVSTSAASVSVDVNVENSQDLGGFQFVLAADPGLLEPVSVSNTQFLGGSGREVVCNDPTIAAGTIRVACVTLRDTPAGVDGSGTIATVTFKPLAAGTTDLKLSLVKLVHPDGSELASSNVDARLTITGPGTSRTRLIIISVSAAVVAVLLLVAGFVAVRVIRGRPAGQGA